ncbi:SRPBCC family protein [Actinomadura rugatobispora]|uniref:SRPBCC family protein n=1 Tax=Actinomadura rugatobispora TaxID=1994 RepID=A0ABW1AI62_9ACTN|nr:SRPBCC family protein [Actinomadura rugatobispora]
MGQDRIEREIAIAAPVERVWAVITEPGQVGAWFAVAGKPAEIDRLEPGGRMVVDHGEQGVFPMKIVTVEPPRVFSYRWASLLPGKEATDDNSTLVEFTLRPDGDGTLLRIVESGFDALPISEEERARSFQDHSGGWTDMAERVRDHTEGKKIETLTA